MSSINLAPGKYVVKLQGTTNEPNKSKFYTIIVTIKSDIDQSLVKNALEKISESDLFDGEEFTITKSVDGKGDVCAKVSQAVHKVLGVQEKPVTLVGIFPQMSREVSNEGMFSENFSFAFKKIGLGHIGLFLIGVVPFIFALIGEAVYAAIQTSRGIREASDDVLANLDVFFDAPKGPGTILEILKTAKAVVNNKDSQTILQNMIERGEQLKSCQNNPDEIDLFKDGISTGVTSSSSESPVYIPAGFYEQSQYRPMLVGIHKEGGDKIVIRLFRMDIPKETKIAPYEEFVFTRTEEMGLDDFLQKFLQHLVDNQTKPLKKAEPEKKQKEQLQEMKRAATEITGGKEDVFKTSASRSFPISGFLGALGAVLSSESPKCLKTPSKDPLKLVTVFLQTVDAQLDKNLFIGQICKALVNRLLQYSKGLNPSKQKAYLQSLEKHLGKIEKRLAKDCGADCANSVMTELRCLISDDEKRKQAQLQRNFDKIVQNVSATNTPISITKTGGDLSGPEEKKEVTLGIGAYVDTLKELENTFKEKKIEEGDFPNTIQRLGTLLEEAQKLQEVGSFDAAMRAAIATLETLPIITDDNINQNVLIKQDASVDIVASYVDPLHAQFKDITDLASLTELQNKISKTIQVFSESHLSAGHLLMPQEFLILQNARYLLFQLQQHKMFLMIKKVWDSPGFIQSSYKAFADFVMQFLGHPEDWKTKWNLGREECLTLALFRFGCPELE